MSLKLVSLLFLLIGTTAPAAVSSSPAGKFIEYSCSATTYPAVCVQSLSVYASTIRQSPRQMVRAALSVSIDAAAATKKHVSNLGKFRGLKPREYAALKDCLEEMSDSVEQLSRSAAELKSIGQSKGTEYIWHMSNLQTWVSAALTDDGTCMDGFSGRALEGRIKSSIRLRMTNLAEVTSNALALCNHFAGKY